MTVKVGNAEFTVDGYYNTSQTIHNWQINVISKEEQKY